MKFKDSFDADKLLKFKISYRFREAAMFNKVGDWLFSVAVKKMIKRLVVLIIARVSALELKKAGVEVDWEQFDTWLTGGLFGLFTVGTNWLKMKTGWKFL